MSQVRVALFGAGAMGSNHARVIAESKHAKLSCIVDPYEPFGTALAERFGTRWVADASQLPEVDAIVVATATEAHFAAAHDFVASGVHALIEKPLTSSLAESSVLVNASRAADSVLMCGLLERFNPAVLTAERFIHEPRHVVAIRHSPFTPRIKTHVAWDLMIHDVDLAIRVFGSEPVSARSVSMNVASDNGVADVSDAILQFAGGPIASISSSRASQRKIRSVSISQAEKLIEVDLLRRNVTLFHNVQESDADDGRGYRQAAVIEIPELTSSVEPLTAQFDHFAKLISGEADRAAERDSILAPHRALEALLAP